MNSTNHTPTHATILDSLDLKSRSDDRLAHLPPEDRDRLAEWLQDNSLAKVQQLAAQPRPEGLEINTNTTALCRFKKKLKLARLLESRLDLHALAESVSNFSPGPLPDLRPLLLQSLEEKAFQELADPDVSLSEQSKLASLALRLAKLRDDEQRRALEVKNHELRQRRAAVQDEELRLRRNYQQIALQNQNLATQRFTFQSIHQLRQIYPFPDQINHTAESQDIQAVTRVLQTILTATGETTPSGASPDERSTPIVGTESILSCD